MSLPMRERELKPNERGCRGGGGLSLPMRERELKHGYSIHHSQGKMSLPMRERELKRPETGRSSAPVAVAPHAGA